MEICKTATTALTKTDSIQSDQPLPPLIPAVNKQKPIILLIQLYYDTHSLQWTCMHLGMGVKQQSLVTDADCAAKSDLDKTLQPPSPPPPCTSPRGVK